MQEILEISIEFYKFITSYSTNFFLMMNEFLYIKLKTIKYNKVAGKQLTSWVATLFWIAKPILLKTKFWELGAEKVLCTTHWTLLRTFTTPGVKKPNVS